MKGLTRMKLICLLMLLAVDSSSALLMAQTKTETVYRVTKGYYLYQAPPQEEGRGPNGESIPVVLAKGRLSDGGLTDAGQGVGFPGGAKAPSYCSVVFDLMKDRPLDQVTIIVRAPNQYWSIKWVSVTYRTETSKSYRILGRQDWSEKNPVMTFAASGQLARFVKITLNRQDFYQSAPLNEVILMVKGKPDANESSDQAVPPAGKLAREFDIETVLVDRYGQYLYEDWPGKIRSDQELVQDAAKETAELANVALDVKRFDQYGGVKESPTSTASGFFRLEKFDDGRWWFITPEGRRFIMIGLDATDCYEWGYHTPVFKSNGDSRVAFEELPNRDLFSQAYNQDYKEDRVSFLVANLIRKYGANFDQKWLEVTRKRLWDWGFNANAKWSRHTNLRVPYVTTLGPSIGVRRIKWVVDPFDPGFPMAVEQGVKEKLVATKDDPWLVGHTFECEVGWNNEIVQQVLQEGSTCAAKQAIIEFLVQRYDHDLNKVNAVLGVHAKTFADLIDQTIDKPALPPQDMSDFIRLASKQYYRIVKEIIKKYDPNHLFLGSALDPAGWQSSKEWETGGMEYLDAISVDYYGTDPSWIKPYEKYGKPILLLEFSNGVSGRGLNAFGAPLPDQKTRGLYYRRLVEQLVANPLFIGFGWFLYYDQPATARTLGGENYNEGLVNQCDQPYEAMVEEVKKTNHRLYDVHAGRLEPVTLESLGVR